MKTINRLEHNMTGQQGGGGVRFTPNELKQRKR